MAKIKSLNPTSAVMFALMGCFLAANQLLVENIATAMSASEAEMGRMISATYAGSVAAVLIVGEIAQRWGKRKSALLTSIMVMIGALLVLISTGAAGATAGFFIYGTGVGGFESCLMTLVNDNNGAYANRFMNLLQALFSTGAVASPIILARVFMSDQYRPHYAFMALCYASFALYWLRCKGLDRFDVSRGKKKEEGIALFSLLKNKMMLVYMAVMMTYLGAETAFTYWIGTYFSIEGFSEYGANALSAFWLASILGRLMSMRFKSPSGIMAPGFALSAAGCVMLLLSKTALLKMIAVIVVGIGFAPLYAGLSLLAGTLFPKKSAAAFSAMIFSAGVGGILFQPLISRMMAGDNAGSIYNLISLLCVICAALCLWVHRKRAAVQKSRA